MLEQPYEYSARQLVEPDWRRLPGFADVTPDQWRSAQWQRTNCVKNLRQLRGVYGDLLDESFYADVEADQAGRATMSLLLPPQMVNTIVPDQVPNTESVRRDPVRRYMLPVASDRLPG
ncbi:MAG: lysine 2,3-aminomutase, partial [Blastococcus sp.]|nr:lysine 2,3-aminomutase [Blastococcus sp.]